MEKIEKNKPINIKVISLGDSGVGKTALINRQCYDEFQYDSTSTIGFSFLSKKYKIDQTQIRLQFWDTAGQERLRVLPTCYYRGALAVTLCFDLSRRQSFQSLPIWIELLSEFPQPFRQVFLIGCKCELSANVPTHQIINFVEKNQLTYFQTSAKTGEGVNETYNQIARIVAQKYFEEQEAKGIKSFLPKQSQKEKGWCY